MELEKKGEKIGKSGRTKCGREREKRGNEREEKMGKNRNGRENTQGKNTQKYEKMRKDEEVFRNP